MKVKHMFLYTHFSNKTLWNYYDEWLNDWKLLLFGQIFHKLWRAVQTISYKVFPYNWSLVVTQIQWKKYSFLFTHFSNNNLWNYLIEWLSNWKPLLLAKFFKIYEEQRVKSLNFFPYDLSLVDVAKNEMGRKH